MDKILAGVARFQREVFPEQRDVFQKLAFEQNPRALFLTCADSRVMPNLITQCKPGELFQCRDVGNIVPPYGAAYGGVSATIEYSVSVLGVKHVIICGHSDCGAMRALLHSERLAKLPSVLGWLHHAEAARRTVMEVEPLPPEEQLLRALTEQNVVTQLTNLRTHPSVAVKMAKGELSLHGWFYEIETGEVYVLNESKKAFEPVSGNREQLVRAWQPGETLAL
ncbi:MAG: carbonic anhydrase [Bryobacteraceae bacterium]|nr:carbonic anhydrase [Bryobacteraceae bacterium]